MIKCGSIVRNINDGHERVLVNMSYGGLDTRDFTSWPFDFDGNFGWGSLYDFYECMGELYVPA